MLTILLGFNMNIDKIKKIVNDERLDKDHKEFLILCEFADDQTVVPDILKLQRSEREAIRQLLGDTNTHLSTALGVLDSLTIEKQGWIVDRIKQHYLDNKDRLKCCIKVDGLP